MNQVIVRWDTPDESGNRTSSVPAADLVDEEAATELHLDDGQGKTHSKDISRMNPNPSIPPTTQRLRDLIDLSRSGLAGPDCLDTALTDFEHESGLPVTTADQSTVVDHCGHTPEGVTG